MTIGEFEHDLQNAFAAQSEPADNGFSKRVARKIARRESGRWPVLAASFAIILAALFSGLGSAYAPLASLLDGVQSRFVGVDLGAMMDVVGWSLAQVVIALGTVSPYALVIGVTAAGAVAYAAQSE